MWSMQSILNRFVPIHDGTRVAKVQSSTEAKLIEIVLEQNGHSYQTRIQKSKKKGREFVITLLEAG